MTSQIQINPKTIFSELPQNIQDQLNSFHENKQMGRLKFEALLKQNQNGLESDLDSHMDDNESYILLELEAIELKTEKLSQKLETVKHSMIQEEKIVEDIKLKVSEQVKDVEYAKSTFLGLQAPSASRNLQTFLSQGQNINQMNVFSTYFPNQIGTRSTSRYFLRVANQLEERMHELWRNLEDIENTLNTTEDIIPGPDMLRESLQYQQEAFLRTASALSKIHEDVTLLKETYKNKYIKDGRDPFTKPKPKKTPYSFITGAISRTSTLPGITIQEPEVQLGSNTSSFNLGGTVGSGTSSGFNFGTSSTGNTSSGFNFGTGASGASTGNTSTGGFNFGGTGSSSGTTGGFNFGGSSSTTGPTSSGFNFGTSTTGSSGLSSGFNFGGSGTGSTASTGGFNFGASTTGAPSTGGFNFGGAGSSSGPTSGPTSSGFNFGGAGSSSGATGSNSGFNFGSTGSGSTSSGGFTLAPPPVGGFASSESVKRRRKFT